MKRRTAVTLIVALALVWLYGECSYRRGGKDALLRAAGAVTDSSARETDRRVAALLAREIQRESTLARTGRELEAARTEVARLKIRLRPQPLIADSISKESLVSEVALRDSVIAAQDVVIRATESQLTVWRALAQERGALLTRALAERDAFQAQRQAWQRKAERRFACVGGPAIVGSLGGRALAGIGISCGLRL